MRFETKLIKMPKFKFNKLTSQELGTGKLYSESTSGKKFDKTLEENTITDDDGLDKQESEEIVKTINYINVSETVIRRRFRESVIKIT